MKVALGVRGQRHVTGIYQPIVFITRHIFISLHQFLTSSFCTDRRDGQTPPKPALLQLNMSLWSVELQITAVLHKHDVSRVLTATLCVGLIVQAWLCLPVIDSHSRALCTMLTHLASSRDRPIDTLALHAFTTMQKLFSPMLPVCLDTHAYIRHSADALGPCTGLSDQCTQLHYAVK